METIAKVHQAPKMRAKELGPPPNKFLLNAHTRAQTNGLGGCRISCAGKNTIQKNSGNLETTIKYYRDGVLSLHGDTLVFIQKGRVIPYKTSKLSKFLSHIERRCVSPRREKPDRYTKISSGSSTSAAAGSIPVHSCTYFQN